jgi:hypothetical protein
MVRDDNRQAARAQIAAGSRSARPGPRSRIGNTWPTSRSARCAVSIAPRASIRRIAVSSSGAVISRTGRFAYPRENVHF